MAGAQGVPGGRVAVLWAVAAVLAEHAGVAAVSSLWEEDERAQVQDRLLQLVDLAAEMLGVVGVAEAAGAEDLLAERLGQPPGELGIVAAFE